MIVPGGSGTPTVTVTNNGDVAAPNTVITIPAPPTGYTLGPVSTGGGGTCTPSKTTIRCTGVTVPGSGRVTVSLPVTLAASAADAARWETGTITAVSTPIAALTGTTIRVSGSGTLATAREPTVNRTGSITIAGGGPVVPRAPLDTHVAGTTSAAGPPGRTITHEGGPTNVSPGAITPNDTSDNGESATGNSASSGATGNSASSGATGNSASSGGTGNAASSLPEAGQELSGLVALSVMLVVGGIAARIIARNRPRRRPAAGSF
jgi:hypothetical protein